MHSKASGRLRRVAFAVGLTCAGAGTSRAEVLIEGDELALRVTTNQAPLAEVLATLRSKFRLRYSLTVDPARQVSGTVSGSLHRVVARLLDGHDFVLQRAADGVEIIQLAPRGRANFTAQARLGATVWQIPSAQAMARPFRQPPR
jgi:hypothetical protein